MMQPSCGATGDGWRALGPAMRAGRYIARAGASLDEHEIKLVDVAHEQGAYDADPVYRRAAARKVKLLQSG